MQGQKAPENPFSQEFKFMNLSGMSQIAIYLIRLNVAARLDNAQLVRSIDRGSLCKPVALVYIRGNVGSGN